MSKLNIEERIEALRRLSNADAHIEVVKLLREKNNFLVGRAAKEAAGRGFADLVPEMVNAMERFYRDPVKTDPSNWAKQGILESLLQLNYREAEFYVRAGKYEQWEPKWGGPVDTADTMRVAALGALPDTDLPVLTVLGHLAEALADGQSKVRSQALLVMAHLNSAAAVPLLRYKALLGDGEAEVVGNTLRVLLGLTGEEALDILDRLIAGEQLETALEAILALAESRIEGALPRVEQHWNRVSLPAEHRWAILAALGASPLEGSYALLASIEAEAPGELAAAAREAMAVSRFRKSKPSE